MTQHQLATAARAAIAPFYVMEVMKAAGARAAQGHDVLHLEVGQPGSGAPAAARNAAIRAIEDEALGYTDALGIAPLRERIAAHYGERYGVAVASERVGLATGASGAFTLAFLACFDPGDRVAVLEPGYPCYRNALQALGVEAVPVRVAAETRFQATPELLSATGPLQGVVVASPSNPTGSALTEAELTALASWCSENGVRLISDEIYHRIEYGHPTPTALAHSPDAVVINSFSKYYSMTGWRLGWLVAPPDLVAPIERLAQNLTIAPPSVSQRAALAAMDCEQELDAHVARYARNRRALLDALPAAGMPEFAPADGAFYTYARTSALAANSQQLCRRWLDEIGVAATPGIDFDPVEGNQWVRFSFAGPTDEIERAAERLVAWRPEGSNGQF